MPNEGFEVALDDTDLEWARVRFRTENGQVVWFVVQYETVFNDERHPVVRYDSAHGVPHRDILSRDGEQDKRWFEGMSYGEVMTMGLHDIKANWRRYRRLFYGDDACSPES